LLERNQILLNKCNKLEDELEKSSLDHKMELSSQKLVYEKEIADTTKKLTISIREIENKNFIKKQELSSENAKLIQKDIENSKRIEIFLND